MRSFYDTVVLMGGFPRDHIYAIPQILRAEELKGIGTDYRTVALFAPRSLKDMLVHEEEDQKNAFRTFPLDTVRSLLSEGALQLLVDAEVARNSSRSKRLDSNVEVKW